jgi:hypothetical protein
MTWLTSLPAAVLVVGGLALALLVVIGGRLAVRALAPAAERDAACTVAAPLMPALRALHTGAAHQSPADAVPAAPPVQRV